MDMGMVVDGTTVWLYGIQNDFFEVLINMQSLFYSTYAMYSLYARGLHDHQFNIYVQYVN